MLRLKTALIAICTLAFLAPLDAANSESWNFDAAPAGEVRIAQGNMQCSGALIGADVVMTAAHCVIPVNADHPVAPRDVTFSLLRPGGDVEEFSVRDIAYPSGFKHGENPTRAQIARDVALLRLSRFARDVKADMIAAPDRDQSTLALLPAAASSVLQGEPCDVDYEDEAIMILSCSRERGASGSPVYGLINGSRRLVGVISADGLLSGNKILFAVNPLAVVDDLVWVSKSDQPHPLNH